MEKEAVATKNTNGKPDGTDRRMTCFVVTGFGRKTDFTTGRVLDLDKTYEQLVQPAFDRVGINAFRAIDANLTGSIDSIMYQWLYEADIVIADLSTLNANVFYELGVRHAQKPNTTVIIAESVLMSKIPFDLSSFVIHSYDHAGDEIAADEQKRFVDHLAMILQGILDVEKERLAKAPETERENDSPVYTFLPGMTPPQYAFEKHLAPPLYLPPAARAKKPVEERESLASIIEAAENAKKQNEFERSIELFAKAIEKAGQSKPDIFLAQRLALVTYKNAERKFQDGKIDQATAIDGLLEAEDILKRYCAPKISTDPETLGLSGAINKRIHSISDDMAYLDRAIDFYERGFYVKQDYYNGINVAFMYTMKANLLDDRYEAIVNYGHANMIRKKVAEIVQEIIEDEEHFGTLPDSEKQWIYMTQAECFQGMGMDADAQQLAQQIEKVATEFGKDAFKDQQQKLRKAMEEFKQRVRPETLAQPAPAGSTPVPLVANPDDTVTLPATPSPAEFSKGAITIDADIVKNKPIKSVEVNCKIEYQ